MSKPSNREFRWWCTRLKVYALAEAHMTPNLTEPFWRECFDDGMTPEQAFAESFVEQDGI